MAKTGNKFTAGERRGMILILVILSVIVACMYFYSDRREAASDAIATDTASVVQLRNAIEYDTIKQRPKKKRRKKQNKTRKTVPVRDPLSQPVPQETK